MTVDELRAKATELETTFKQWSDQKVQAQTMMDRLQGQYDLIQEYIKKQGEQDAATESVKDPVRPTSKH